MHNVVYRNARFACLLTLQYYQLFTCCPFLGINKNWGIIMYNIYVLQFRLLQQSYYVKCTMYLSIHSGIFSNSVMLLFMPRKSRLDSVSSKNTKQCVQMFLCLSFPFHNCYSNHFLINPQPCTILSNISWSAQQIWISLTFPGFGLHINLRLKIQRASIRNTTLRMMAAHW